jgi:hypothetical protein
VPTTLPNGNAGVGCLFGPDEDQLQQGLNAAGVLNPGDSVTINTEAPVYIGCIGAAATGDVQAVVEFNPPGGGLGTGA